MTTFEETLALTALAAGREPLWIEQTDAADGSGNPDYTGAPGNSSGCSMLAEDGSGTLLAHVVVELRENVTARRVWVSRLNHVGGETYTISVDLVGGAGPFAVAYVSGGGDTWEQVVDGLIAALPGVVGAAALVTFVRSGSGNASILVITGKQEADFYFITACTGAATVAVVAEATSCTARKWARYSATSPIRYTSTTRPMAWQLDSHAVWSISYRGMRETVDASGSQKAYLELYGMTGVAGDAVGAGTLAYEAHVWWGPCIQE